jgi:hypothetical protein
VIGFTSELAGNGAIDPAILAAWRHQDGLASCLAGKSPDRSSIGASHFLSAMPPRALEQPETPYTRPQMFLNRPGADAA